MFVGSGDKKMEAKRYLERIVTAPLN